MTEKTIFSEAYTNDICKVFEDNFRYDAPLSTSTDNGGFKRLKDANLSDNFMFAKVMSDPTILKEFLQIVLGIKIRRIVMTQYEKTIFPDPAAKSIRLDVYADDSHNRKYSVEMQGYVEYNIGRRSRYYQSVIDIDSLSRGQGYERLSDAFVIFVCTYDPFGAGMQKYVFQKRCINTDSGITLNDGVSTVILTDNSGDPVINEFFKYLKNSTYEEAERSESRLIKLINQKVEKVRFDPALEVEYMRFQELQREQFNRGLQQGREQGIAENQLAIIKNMLNMDMTDDTIQTVTGCTAEYLASVKKNIAN